MYWVSLSTTEELLNPVTSPSFEELADIEYSRAIGLAVSLLGDRDAAVDVAQEALLRAYREWDRVQRLERPGAWVRRVVLNLCSDQLRRRTRKIKLLNRLTRQPSTKVETSDSALPDVQLWAAVRQLPPRARSVVALRFVLDLSIDAIADDLGCPAGTVKSDLSRALAHLRTTLSKEDR